MKYQLSIKNKKLQGSVNLPGSKSVSNRVLIIQALCEEDFSIHHLSPSDDSRILAECLNSKSNELDVGLGGTTMRFLTALLASKEGNWLLTGPAEIRKRPVGKLVDALRSIGANIQYEGEVNYLPLRIQGTDLTGNILTVDTSESSQFISALLLIAPTLPNGLKIFLAGKMVSMFYIRMTLKIMEYFGIDYTWDSSILVIPRQPYKARDIVVEGDWTAASYFYQIAAFSEEAELLLPGLANDSSQGDAIIADLMSQFGIKTTFEEERVRITKQAGTCREFTYDFIDSPDLAQTLLVTCAGLGVPAKITGLDNLHLKETNRIEAMQNELMKMGVLFEKEEKEYHLSGKIVSSKKAVNTYGDHRMAMAFAPLALLQENFKISHPDVVTKSYPGFWDDLKSLGFVVTTK